jgi:electron transfer flavoprotein alpha subunit
MPGTLIIAEVADGKVRKSTYSAFGFAKQLGSSFDVLVIGAQVRAAADELVPYGAGTIFVCEDATLAGSLCERVVPTVARLVTEHAYDTVVVTASAFGKDLAPRVAARLGSGYAPDINRIDTTGGGRRYRRSMYSGSVHGWLEIATERHVVSVRQSEFQAPAPTSSPASIAPVPLAEPEAAAARIEWIGTQHKKSERPDLAEARVVVAGGRALKDRFAAMLDPLADALGAAVGASRAACDAGYVAPELQIGQTGRTVAPDLYFAIGISGAIQHVVGMKASKVIVAINKDAEAPIFQIADFGLVQDLFAAVPELTREIKASAQE